MNDLTTKIDQAFAQLEASGDLAKIITDAVTKTTVRVVDSVIGSYSPFAKELEKDIAERLAVDFKRIPIESYNASILNIIKAQLDGMVDQKARDQINLSLSELLRSAPQEISKREPSSTVDVVSFQVARTSTASLQFQGRSSLSLEARWPRASWSTA